MFKNLFWLIVLVAVGAFMIYHLVLKSPDFVQVYGLTENYIEMVADHINRLSD